MRSGALLADFVGLFIEGCVLLALAVLLATPQFFSWCWVTLLAIDVVWGFAAHLAFSQDVKPKAELSWAWINLITIAVLVPYLVVIGPFPPTAGATEAKLTIGVLVASVVRTLVDYARNWNYYYPPTAS